MSGPVKKCTCCNSPVTREIIHPLLYVPICEKCHKEYNSGEFTIEDGNEIFCRFCGEGEGELILCDSCPKSFCSRCIETTCGNSELRRIQKLSDRWHCFICSPQPIQDLCIKNGWKYHLSKDAIKEQKELNKQRYRKGVIYSDISRGREKFEIPVVNEVDSAPPPIDFVYVTEPVAGEGVILSNNPSCLTCCTCTDNCRDPSRCECALRMGGSFAYDSTGIIVNDKEGGIFECNAQCSCNVTRCKNRVVGNGPHLRLEVFRCDNPLKGWGVRCIDDIQAGTYVADYLGEMLLEEDSEKRGLILNDEYLFTLDSWGRSCAAEKIRELGIKTKLLSVKREEDMDITTMTKEDVSKYLDPELVELLDKKGAISRALEMGRRLREEPEAFLKEQKAQFDNEHAISVLTVQKGAQVRPGTKASLKKPTGKKYKAFLDLDADDLSAAGTDDGRLKHGRKRSSAAMEAESAKAAAREPGRQYRSWMDLHLVARQSALDNGISIINDRTITEVEESTQTYTVDGR